MIKNLGDIEKAFGLKEGDFKAMYEDKEEKEIPIADLEIIKKADLNTRIENIKKDTQSAQTEIAAKELKKKFGIEVEGKDLFKVVDAITESVKTKTLEEAKIEPTQKVKELTNDLNVMKGNFEKVSREKTELESTYKQKENRTKINSTIVSSLPKELIISTEDAAELSLKRAGADGISVDISDEGKVVFKKGDQILKDSNLVPLGADVVLKDYYSSYAKPAGGGDGGKDNAAAGKPGSYEAFEKEMTAAGKGPGSQDFNREMQKRIKEKTLKM